jgi:hypothetical protein
MDVRLLFICISALTICGCMQVVTRVKLHEDGSAIITERVQFSRRLLDLGGSKGSSLDIASLLTREAARKRMQHMGKGIRLVSHKVNDVEGGAKEAVTVFTIEDIRELRYVSPFLAYKDYTENNAVKCVLSPVYKGTWSGRVAGDIAVAFRPLSRPQSHPRLKEGEPVPKGPDPVELQVYRELRPIFKDMLKGFKLRFIFECYTPLRATGFGMKGERRGRNKSGVNYVDLINISDKDLDKFGDAFFGNEEVMVDLLRFKLGSRNVVEHVREFTKNRTVPVFLPKGSRHMYYLSNDEIFFRPSRQLFKKYFEGKKLHFYHSYHPLYIKGGRPARFEEIGYRKGMKVEELEIAPPRKQPEAKGAPGEKPKSKKRRKTRSKR